MIRTGVKFRTRKNDDTGKKRLFSLSPARSETVLIKITELQINNRRRKEHMNIQIEK